MLLFQEKQKIDKYLGLTIELKKVWKVIVTVIPMIVAAHEIVFKGLEKRLTKVETGRIETRQATKFSRLARILRKDWKT